MDQPAAITAELVDVRNVGMHKCIKLTLHVPAERASEVMAAFGWPTAVDPVPVALARLNLEAKEVMPADTKHNPRTETPPASPVGPRNMNVSEARAATVRAPIAPDKRLTQRAGILANDPMFQNWLRETNAAWKIMQGTDEEKAAMLIRVYCEVKTRRDIIPGTDAASLFDNMLSRYAGWQACLEEVAS